MPIQHSTSAGPIFELGKLYCERGDFQLALSHLQEATETFHKSKDVAGLLRCQNLILRIYAEMENDNAVTIVKERLHDYVIKENIQLNSKTFYTLALCTSYKGQHKTALEYLEKALALALVADDKEDICYAISGLAIVYFALGRYEDALKEIYNLQVFFQVLPLPELKLSSQLMNGHILRKLGQHAKALELFWQCYEQLKTQKNLYMYINLLYALGVTYLEAKETDMARVYLSLAKRSADPENLKYLSRQIDAQLELIGTRTDSRYDLVFEVASNSIIERRKGRIDFKNQFILLDMLRLFLQNPGEVYSKENLVKVVWKQEYDPKVHDNKIYVTIKRLRQLIEPDFDKPKYIFRAKNGYYLNRNTRVYFEQ